MQMIGPDGGIRYDSMGDSMRFVLTAADTAGQYTVIEDTLKPGFHAALHLHRAHSESFYVLEGQVHFALGSEELAATPGTTVFVPPGVPHAAWSDGPGKMLTVFSPGGLEGAMAAFSRLSPEEARAPATSRAILAQYDIVDLARPPIPGLVGLYHSLLRGDAGALRTLFAGEPLIDTPLAGAVRGEAALETFVAAQCALLQERRARPQVVGVIDTPERAVVELVLNLAYEGRAIDLPVVIAADLAGERVTALRVYHSTWPLTGGHRIRPPLLGPPPTPLEEPAVIRAYMEALEQPDPVAMLNLFTDDGYVREPSGAGYRHAGPAGRRAFYDQALASGGVVLHHRTATFDGHSFAVEYVCDRWGQAALPPQAGMAVYELAGAGRVAAVRIYDDISPPMPEP